jgi:uncharacterized protein YraI
MVRRLFVVVIVLMVGVLFSSMTGITSAQEFGTNWTAQFYNSNDLGGSVVQTISGINGINFNWGTAQPTVNGTQVDVGPETFSIRFASTQNFQQGVYNFTLSYDDGVRMFIDGAKVMDVFNGEAGGYTTRSSSFTYNMVAGSHNLTVEYFDGVGNANIQVQWGLATGVTPVSSATFGPTPTPGPTNTPAPTSLPSIPSGSITATVIRATVLNVRAAPSVYSDRIGTVRRGQTYAVIGRDDRARWFLVQLSGYQGWVFGYYLFINGNEFNVPVVSTYVLQDNPASISGVVARAYAGLKLRAQPTINSQQIGRIGWGDVMAVTGRSRSGEWLRVVWRGTTGWVYEPFTRIVEGDINAVPVVE